jgi:hypothetical protein
MTQNREWREEEEVAMRACMEKRGELVVVVR